ncbi:MAG: TauD/TfdA family dioxygenase [Pseudomonadota bacterium]|nr:TauD/TfdA family dioxygenase [Pseudomonadota bacterium]
MQASAVPEIVSAPPLDLQPLDSHGLDHAECSAPASGTPPLFIKAVAGAFETASDVLDWGRRHRTILDALILEHGGIVLRDFPIRTSKDFDTVIAAFPAYKLGYIGGAGPRSKITGKVMEATQLNQNLGLTLHSEMGYTRTFPQRIAFFCLKPAEVGGETTIGSLRELMCRLPAGLKEKLERCGARTIRNFARAGASQGRRVEDHPDNRGWDDAFATDDPRQVEAYCATMGMDAIWNEDGSLTLICEQDTHTTHPQTGERIYRSQMHTNAHFASSDSKAVTQALRAAQKRPSRHEMLNGEELPLGDCETIAAILREVTVAWPWHAGDTMILDNLLVAHGRNPYSGTRDTQVALLE